MLRKFSGILLIAVLILPFSASFFYLHYQKKQVKRSVKQSLMYKTDKEDLTKFVFSKNFAQDSLKWHHSWEFEYNNKMYDIVESICRKDSITYFCWLDREETELNNKLKDLVANAMNQNQRANNPLKNFKKLASSLFSPETQFKLDLKLIESEVKYINYKNHYSKIVLNIDSPPPKS